VVFWELRYDAALGGGGADVLFCRGEIGCWVYGLGRVLVFEAFMITVSVDM
jgi:hypothetical protein